MRDWSEKRGLGREALSGKLPPQTSLGSPCLVLTQDVSESQSSIVIDLRYTGETWRSVDAPDR
jgi:hypothetical protein